MNKRLDLNLLPIAIAIFEERGVSKAAARLGMSQPAVSLALAKLRAAFDDPLFVRTGQGMESGEIDLAVGYFPDLEKANFFQQRLFTHHFCCLLRADHPIGGNRLLLKHFLELQHVVVRAESRSQELFERFLASKRIPRK